MIFYTSDLHFCHGNIIKLCNRPFNNVNEMNETLINKWNKRIDKNDIVYILGDIGYPKNNIEINKIIEIIKSLNGKKYLIIGNHDLKLIRNKEFTSLFEKIEHYMEIFDNEQKVILSHYPMEEWNGFYRNTIHLYGHVHNNESNLRKIQNRYNVGVDINSFEPKLLKELIA